MSEDMQLSNDCFRHAEYVVWLSTSLWWEEPHQTMNEQDLNVSPYVCITLWYQACRSMFPKQLAVVQSLSHMQLWATSWAAAHQSPLSLGFSRKEYWRRLPFPPLGDLPDPQIEPTSPALVDGFFTTELSGKSSYRLSPPKILSI